MAHDSSPLSRRHRLIAINLGLIRPKALTRIERGSISMFQWQWHHPIAQPSRVSPTLDSVRIARDSAYQALQARIAAKESAKAA